MKLSVAFIVYNGSNYMEQQLDSILSQTVKVDEIVVCEDNSTDNTREILEKYNKANPSLFKILYNTQNLGSNKNAVKAIQNCSGDIVFLSDQDDEWLPNKVERTLQYFKQNPKMNGVFSNGYLMNAQSEVDPQNVLWDSMSFPFEQLKNNTALLKKYIHTNENCATGAAMAFRRNLAFLDQPFPSIKFLIHDRWISMNLSNENSLGYIEDKLIKYRLHDKQQVGGKTEKMQKYIKINWDLLNNQIQIDNFQDMKYILNRIEINMHVQYQIKKYAQKLYDNTDWIKLLEEKHKLYINYAFKHFPLLTFLRSIKKIFSPTFSR
jgi:glycosyltransferase involved in cell wall biosynthesis